jgi:hypothetical protein
MPDTGLCEITEAVLAVSTIFGCCTRSRSVVDRGDGPHDRARAIHAGAKRFNRKHAG